MAGNEDSSIIIKKIKKVEGGHHGGAWKVAYADFVTAMMAFFLLLWLLNVTTEEQKAGISDYFTPTVGLRDSEGIGFQGGQSSMDEGTKKSELTPVAITAGAPTGQTQNKTEKTLVDGDQEAQLFEQAREEIKQAMEDDPSLRDFKDNIIVEQTPEGLKIEIADSDKYPMFQSGGAVMSEYGLTILGKMAKVIEKMPNFISVTGHTDGDALSAKGGTYTNWELSADRANSARTQLVKGGMEGNRVGKVVGMADMELKFPDEPKSPKNRRISIILLKGSHFNVPKYLNSHPTSIISVPKLTGGAKKPDAAKTTGGVIAPKKAAPTDAQPAPAAPATPAPAAGH